MLGLQQGATEKEITRAYRKLAKQHHPDANPGNKDAEEKFKDISTAYDVLGDAAKRKEYDEVRDMVASGAGNPFAGAGPRRVRRPGRRHPVGDTGDMGDVGGLGDLLGNIFGGRGRRAQSPPARGRAPPGRRPRGRGPPVVRRRRPGRHHRRPADRRRPLPHLRGDGRRPRHRPAALPAVQRRRHAGRRPGPVLLLPDLPPLRRERPGGGEALPDLRRRRGRDPHPGGQGPHPGRGGRRPARPGEGQGHAGQQRRAAGRPLCHRPRRAPPAVRAARATTCCCGCR